MEKRERRVCRLAFDREELTLGWMTPSLLSKILELMPDDAKIRAFGGSLDTSGILIESNDFDHVEPGQTTPEIEVDFIKDGVGTVHVESVTFPGSGKRRVANFLPMPSINDREIKERQDDINDRLRQFMTAQLFTPPAKPVEAIRRGLRCYGCGSDAWYSQADDTYRCSKCKLTSR